MTVYDLPGPLHPEFEPRVIEDEPLTTSGMIATRVELETPYLLKTTCRMVLFVAEKPGDRKHHATVFARSRTEVWAMRSCYGRPFWLEFARHMVNEVKRLGDRVLDEVVPIVPTRLRIDGTPDCDESGRGAYAETREKTRALQDLSVHSRE